MELRTEQILKLTSLTLVEDADTHYHWDPETQFYNHCHGKGGKFCTKGEGGGGGMAVTGRSLLPDSDGNPPEVKEKPAKRGRLGASLVDPNEGTRTIDGIRGYDAKGKPVPGSDAWVESHNISPAIFKSRPYIKYEADQEDPALHQAFPKDGKAPWGDSTKAYKLFVRTSTQEHQNGGYIMYKHGAPGTPHPPVAPQVRPNASIITDLGKYKKAETQLKRDTERQHILESTTPTQLIKERKQRVKQAELSFELAQKTTAKSAKEHADKELATAKEKFDAARASTKDPEARKAIQKEWSDAKRAHEKVARRTSNPNFVPANIESNTLNLKNAQNALANAQKDPKKALANAITDQKGLVKRSQNAFDKAAAKYVFTPGVSSARVDVSQDPTNLKNLTKGKGRIYLAMEGAIKNDAILTSVKKEDPTAAVVNVPSVTLWQQKKFAEGTPEDVLSEIQWFADKYTKKRDVILIPDADGVTNPAVMRQAKALQASLLQNGAGKVYLAIPPLKAGTTRQVDDFELPSGKAEKRKGIDDHLGAGRGTLGQLRFETNTEYPNYSLKNYGVGKVAPGAEKLNTNGMPAAESVLAAISHLVGTNKGGSAQIPLKTLNQAAGFRDSQKSTAGGARTNLERLGIIKVEYVFDKAASARGERILNPEMTEERRQELIKQGTIKQPHIYKQYTEISYDLAPVITILKPEYLIKPSSVKSGSLAELPNWKPPATFKGWTSSVDGSPDKTGIAKRLEDEHAKFIAKNKLKATQQVKTEEIKPTRTKAASKAAPAGRRLVRTKAGAKKYGVDIGQPIPLSIEELLSMTMLPELELVYVDESADEFGDILMSLVNLSETMSQEELEEFYNQCHGQDGKFCQGKGESGKFFVYPVVKAGEAVAKTINKKLIRPPLANKVKGADKGNEGWPAQNAGRPISRIARARIGSVEVDGIKAKAVYEITASNGNKIRLYDKTGKAKRYAGLLLNNHAKMNELYPLQPPRGIVVTNSSHLFAKTETDKNTFAMVRSNEPYTYVNANLLGKSLKGAAKKGFNMPSAGTGNVRNMDYVLTHEYGHQLDFARHTTNGYGYRSHPLWHVDSLHSAMSIYGRSVSNGAEAYAESFAEWHHSQGKTKNPYAIAMARHEKWHGYQSLTASGMIEIVSMTLNRSIYFDPDREIVSMVLDFDELGDYTLSMTDDDLFQFADALINAQEFPDDTDEDIEADVPDLKGPGIAVLDDFENGPSISGDKDTIEPTQSEIDAAAKIVQEVFAELGLDENGEAR